MAASSTPTSRQGAPAALLNGLAILESFSSVAPSLTVTQIAANVGLHKSTVSRVLQGMAEAGYVLRDPGTGKYQLGLRVLRLAAPLLADLDARVAARPYLEHLSTETQETAALTLWNGKNAVVVDQVASPHQVKHTASVGTQYDRWQSSSVRVVLAHLPKEEVMRLLESGEVRFSDGNPDREQVSEELQAIMEKGYAINYGQTTPEEFGIAAPIYDLQGSILGGLVVSAPLSRVEHQGRSEFMIQKLKEAAAAVTMRLGKPSGVALTSAS